MDDRERDEILEKIRRAIATADEAGFGGVMTEIVKLMEAAAELYTVFLHGGKPAECVQWRMPLPLWADGSGKPQDMRDEAHMVWCQLLSAEMDIAEESGLKYVDMVVMERLRRIVRLIETNYDRFGKWEERQ